MADPDIPADVMEAANALVAREMAAERRSVQRMVALGMLAERERCATVAEEGFGEGTFGSSRGLDYLNAYMAGRFEAATAIRKGTKHG